MKNDALPNFLVNQENHIDAIFKNLVDANSMSVRAWSSTMYELCKINKQEEGCRHVKHVEDIHKQSKFTTTIYRKPSFNGMYSNFESFLPSIYKLGLVFTLKMFSLKMFLYLPGLGKISYRINF